MAMCGGSSSARQADAEVQAVCAKIRTEVEKQANGGSAFDNFTAVSVITQLVAGMNYFVKVQTGDSSYIHIRVYQDLSQSLSLSAFRTVSDADELKYFE